VKEKRTFRLDIESDSDTIFAIDALTHVLYEEDWITSYQYQKKYGIHRLKLKMWITNGIIPKENWTRIDRLDGLIILKDVPYNARSIGGRRYSFTDKEKSLMWQMIQDKTPIDDVAHKFGCSRDTLYKLIKKNTKSNGAKNRS
jgi:hypothetical protein